MEHCDNPDTQQIIMDEIMQSVCNLAQDQYGNYVIQVFKIPVHNGLSVKIGVVDRSFICFLNNEFDLIFFIFGWLSLDGNKTFSLNCGL